MEKSLTKTFAILVIVVAIFALPAKAQEWNCGHPNNLGGGAATVKATLSDGTLTISGVGAMANYDGPVPPWYNSRNSITNVVIGNGVTSIGQVAFRDCVNLISITIGNDVTSIGSNAFRNCIRLTSINAELNNANLSSQEGVLFNKDRTVLAQYPTGRQGSYIIPTSVTAIGGEAFQGCTGLTSITIPNSVTTIGYIAFQGCTGLTSVTIPSSVTFIGIGAFSGCTGLTSVTIPSSVISIGIGAFSGCTGLTSIIIPSSVTSIEERAFSGCTGLTSIIIPNSVTTIGNEAFRGCTGLTSITIPNSVTTIGNEAFWGCTGLTSITIPNSVTTIGNQAFRGCTGLTSVTIGNSVTKIEFQTFYDCTGLTSVTIPNSVTTIGYRAFFDCTGLTSVIIPNSVTEIESGAFWGCTNLTSVTISESMTRIGENVFIGTGLTSVTIPNSVTVIARSAFRNCRNLTSVTIGNSVTTIEEEAFRNCIRLTSITIPSNVTSIENEAFMNCFDLTSITISSSLTSIVSNAFWGCISLKSIISLNATPPQIGTFTFLDIDKANVCLYVPQGNEGAYSEALGWKDFSCINTVLAGDIIVIAVFDAQLGSVVTPQILVLGGKAVSPIAPTRTGYIFGGWYKEAACINLWDFDTNVTDDITIYAKWINIVSFDSRGGSSVSPQNVDSGDKVTQPTAPTRTGYTFGGWYKEEACVNAWNFATDVVTNRITLYAKWTINTYAVTWNSDGGTPVPTQTTVNHGSHITAPAAMTKTGYTFGGWYSDEVLTTAVTFPIGNVTTARTFYAKWTLNNYVVTWNADGGTPVPTQTSVNHGNSITAPSAMTKTGYTFNGWYSDEALTSAVTFPIANVTAARTLYAKWTLNNYAVIWNADGGTPVPTQTTINHGSNITAPAAMTKTGYTFNGWFSDEALTSAITFPIANVTASRTFYAKWTLNNYAVTWNADGGAPVPTQTTVNHGNSITAPSTMTKTGYTFGGWYSDEALTAAVTFPIANVTTARTFYAKWTLNNYTITWNADGGTPIPTQTTVNHGSSITAPATMTKTGYTFGGWYSDEALTSAVTFPIANVTTARTFYAKWTLNTYAITWNADGGTPIPTQTTINHGSSITAPAAMSKTGYTFGGWYSDESLTTNVTFPIENVTTAQMLYAKWTFVPVTNIAISFPTTIGVGQEVKLSGTVEPQSANQTISWSIFSASPTGAVIIDGGTLFTVAHGTAFIRATVVNGADNGTANYTQNFFITIGDETSILSQNRIIPQPKPDTDGINAVSVNQLTGGFTVGPNPVAKFSDNVNFFWQGKSIENTKLSIYDASGNLIKNINISDKLIGKYERRIVGYWDLTDSKDRTVAEGTYLVRGIIKTSDGKKERVSVLMGVR